MPKGTGTAFCLMIPQRLEQNHPVRGHKVPFQTLRGTSATGNNVRNMCERLQIVLEFVTKYLMACSF